MSVLVYTENWDGKFKKLSFELVSYASEIAKAMGSSVTALSIGEVGNDELAKLGNYGANKVLDVKGEKLNNLINGAYSSIISQAVEKAGASIIVLSNNI
jgi:electron transfer flavoprotein alpha subunit